MFELLSFCPWLVNIITPQELLEPSLIGKVVDEKKAMAHWLSRGDHGEAY